MISYGTLILIDVCSIRASNELMWCVLSEEELRKCEAFAAATADDQEKTQEQAFGSYYRKVNTTIQSAQLSECFTFYHLQFKYDFYTYKTISDFLEISDHV